LKKKQRVITVKAHRFHEATPLSITKVPEGQPKLKVFQPFLGGAIRQSPPGLDGEVPRFRLEHRGCVVILEAETLVLVLQIMLDIELGVFFQRPGPMEVASSLTPIDENLWISRPVNNPHGIPIGLDTVGHEAFEVGLGDSMAGHDVVEVNNLRSKKNPRQSMQYAKDSQPILTQKSYI
jgi:hypothetical protein